MSAFGKGDRLGERPIRNSPIFLSNQEECDELERRLKCKNTCQEGNTQPLLFVPRHRVTRSRVPFRVGIRLIDAGIDVLRHCHDQFCA